MRNKPQEIKRFTQLDTANHDEEMLLIRGLLDKFGAKCPNYFLARKVTIRVWLITYQKIMILRAWEPPQNGNTNNIEQGTQLTV